MFRFLRRHPPANIPPPPSYWPIPDPSIDLSEAWLGSLDHYLSMGYSLNQAGMLAYADQAASDLTSDQ